MKTAKAFKSGPKKKSWAALIDSLPKFTDDFMEKGRKQKPIQKGWATTKRFVP